MGKSLNRTHPSFLLARTAPLSMALALFACSDRQEQAPAAPSAASVFKDVPTPESPPAPANTPTANAPTAPQGTANAPQGGQPTNANARTPEQLFTSLGCRVCHGQGGAFAASLANARGKSDEVVATWIFDAQKVRPGTMMPTFAGRISTAEALDLAKWIKAGNPAPSK